MIVQVGPYPEPIGGISVYIKRMKQYMDLKGLRNEVWDMSNVNKNIVGISNIRFRYIPLKYLFRRDIKLIHYNICGINSKIYIGFFNKVLFKKRKKILTIHGDSKDLFTKKISMVVKAINSFDTIICVKSGDKEYLQGKGIKKPIYEIPAFIFPVEDEDSTIIPQYILDFISSHKVIICANGSSIQFYENQDLYGIDMCIDLIEKLNKSGKDVGLVFCIPDINNLEYFEKMKSIIKTKEIGNNFLFVNEKMELYPIIKRSHLFIRPTNSDGYGVSIAEALYYEIPSIASDVCKRPKGTILFKSRDLEDLFQKVTEVISTYELHKEKIQSIKYYDNAELLLEVYNSTDILH